MPLYITPQLSTLQGKSTSPSRLCLILKLWCPGTIFVNLFLHSFQLTDIIPLDGCVIWVTILEVFLLNCYPTSKILLVWHFWHVIGIVIDEGLWLLILPSQNALRLLRDILDHGTILKSCLPPQKYLLVHLSPAPYHNCSPRLSSTQLFNRARCGATVLAATIIGLMQKWVCICIE